MGDFGGPDPKLGRDTFWSCFGHIGSDQIWGFGPLNWSFLVEVATSWPLYIYLARARGPDWIDSMIHILQSVTFGKSHFGLLTLLCEMFQKGPNPDPRNDAIWDPFGTPKWTNDIWDIGKMGPDLTF